MDITSYNDLLQKNITKTYKESNPSHLDRINTRLANILQLNQWQNTKAILSWFNNIQHKDMYSFIAFDVVEFYPSLSISISIDVDF